MGHRVNPLHYRLGFSKDWSYQLRDPLLMNIFIYRLIKSLIFQYSAPYVSYRIKRNSNELHKYSSYPKIRAKSSINLSKEQALEFISKKKKVIKNPFQRASFTFSHINISKDTNLFISIFLFDEGAERARVRNRLPEKIFSYLSGKYYHRSHRWYSFFQKYHFRASIGNRGKRKLRSFFFKGFRTFINSKIYLKRLKTLIQRPKKQYKRITQFDSIFISKVPKRKNKNRGNYIKKKISYSRLRNLPRLRKRYRHYSDIIQYPNFLRIALSKSRNTPLLLKQINKYYKKRKFIKKDGLTYQMRFLFKAKKSDQTPKKLTSLKKSNHKRKKLISLKKEKKIKKNTKKKDMVRIIKLSKSQKPQKHMKFLKFKKPLKVKKNMKNNLKKFSLLWKTLYRLRTIAINKPSRKIIQKTLKNESIEYRTEKKKIYRFRRRIGAALAIEELMRKKDVHHRIIATDLLERKTDKLTEKAFSKFFNRFIYRSFLRIKNKIFRVYKKKKKRMGKKKKIISTVLKRLTVKRKKDQRYKYVAILHPRMIQAKRELKLEQPKSQKLQKPQKLQKRKRRTRQVSKIHKIARIIFKLKKLVHIGSPKERKFLYKHFPRKGIYYTYLRAYRKVWKKTKRVRLKKELNKTILRKFFVFRYKKRTIIRKKLDPNYIPKDYQIMTRHQRKQDFYKTLLVSKIKRKDYKDLHWEVRAKIQKIKNQAYKELYLRRLKKMQNNLQRILQKTRKSDKIFVKKRFPIWLLNTQTFFQKKYIHKHVFKNLKILLFLIRYLKFYKNLLSKKRILLVNLLVNCLSSLLTLLPKGKMTNKLYIFMHLCYLYMYSFRYQYLQYNKKIFHSRFMRFNLLSKMLIFSLKKFSFNLNTNIVRLRYYGLHNRNYNAQFILNYLLIKLGQYYKIEQIINPLMYNLKRMPFIKGFRFIISGRLTRKERAFFIVKSAKRMPLSSQNCKIDSATDIKIMKFGVVGIKIYLSYIEKYMKPYYYFFEFKTQI